MTRSYIPDIMEEHFAAFRDIMPNHMPACYGDWVQLAARLRNSVATRGKDVAFVVVKPDRFQKFLKANGCEANATAMVKCAREIASTPANSQAKATVMA
jgi:hypothetical protein